MALNLRLVLDILDRDTLPPLEELFADSAELSDVACRHCHKPIAKDVFDVWQHLSRGGFVMTRGCRANSYDDASGWDDSLPRSANVTPPKK
jgi:hypothetical protein